MPNPRSCLVHSGSLSCQASDSADCRFPSQPRIVSLALLLVWELKKTFWCLYIWVLTWISFFVGLPEHLGLLDYYLGTVPASTLETRQLFCRKSDEVVDMDNLIKLWMPTDVGERALGDLYIWKLEKELTGHFLDQCFESLSSCSNQSYRLWACAAPVSQKIRHSSFPCDLHFLKAMVATCEGMSSRTQTIFQAVDLFVVLSHQVCQCWHLFPSAWTTKIAFADAPYDHYLYRIDICSRCHVFREFEGRW